MNWRDWPDGAESIEYCPNDICPVCSTTLHPVDKWYLFIDPFTQEKTSMYTAICPKCRTKYTRFAPTESISIDANEERIIELEERVRTLENTLSRLISWIRTQQAQPQQIATKQPQEAQDNAEEFTRKYRYLL